MRPCGTVEPIRVRPFGTVEPIRVRPFGTVEPICVRPFGIVETIRVRPFGTVETYGCVPSGLWRPTGASLRDCGVLLWFSQALWFSISRMFGGRSALEMVACLTGRVRGVIVSGEGAVR